MAISVDGKTLYPMLEGALQRRSRTRGDASSTSSTCARSRTRDGRGTPRRRSVSRRGDRRPHGARPAPVRPDRAQRFPGRRGAQKKIYLIDLRRVDADGFLEKRLVLDLLHISDPEGISLPARPGEFGVGNPFSFPLQSVESLEVLGGERLLIANDNNFPFSDGRWIARDRPDDTELIIVRVPALR